MPEAEPINLHAAMNAVSDVIMNRPRPIRLLDQIYMKAGDMVLQSEFVARWADGKRLAFVGDGDAISVCVAYLKKREILGYGPSKIVVFDFDERICNAVKRFADSERIETLDSVLYNCLDPFPDVSKFDCFYTNPPWGASNAGESVKAFVQRGMEATQYGGEGLVVIADDPNLPWPQIVLQSVQRFAIDSGYFVQKMMPRMHNYHLDDDPNLRSCNLLLKSVPENKPRGTSQPISDPDRLRNFYGKDSPPKVKYVRERKRVDYGDELNNEYFFDSLEGSK